jgi:protein phosphatase
MGGEANGELASLVTVQSLRPCALDEVFEIAGESIAEANEMLCDEMLSNGGKRMGSTLAALYVDETKAVAVNIGDSRIYRMRDGVLQQLSKDHTIVQQMVDMGAITKAEARTHKRRHVLSQNIGIFPEEMMIEPHFTEPFDIEAEDVFVLCSDGLTDMVTDEEIGDALAAGDIAKQGELLLKRALENGGRDNVTIHIVKVRS